MKEKNPIKKFMTLIPYHMSDTASVEAVLNKMQELKIHHMPIFTDNKLLGILSKEELEVTKQSLRGSELTAGSVIKQDPYIVLPDHPLEDVLHEMITSDRSSCLIEEVDGSIVGIFTTKDAMLVLTSLLKHIEGDFIKDKLWEYFSSEFQRWKDSASIS